MLNMPTADALSRYLDLATQQMKLTAANMANQNTDGYTRRAVTFHSGDSVTIGNRSASTGVTATVKPQTDAVLQKSVWQSTEASSASSARSTALNALQSTFALDAEGNDATGINASLAAFFNAQSALAAMPADPLAQQAALSSARAFTASMNRAASQVAAQRTALDAQAVSSVDTANGLASSIASLNKQIATSGVGADTSALQDQRNALITQLATQIDVNVATSDDGSMNLSLSDGTPLVSGSGTTALTTRLTGGVSQILSGTTTVTGIIHGGILGGTLQARDGDLPNVTSQLDAVASAFTSAVNAAQQTTATSPLFSFAGNTASTIAVDSVITQPSTTADGSAATAIAALSSQALIGTQTLSGALASMASSLGTLASAASTTSTADAAVLTQTSGQLSKLSGVSLDTEAANLTQYQRSYQAAAKVLSIVNELMAQAINLGTGTTVS